MANKRSRTKGGYRSKLEARLAAGPLARCAYETRTLSYRRKDGRYTPDFVTPSGVLLEVKGLLTAQDRSKMLAVIEQHPKEDIRMVFMYPLRPLYKGSKTTAAEWADKHSIRWCDAKDTKTLRRWANG